MLFVILRPQKSFKTKNFGHFLIKHQKQGKNWKDVNQKELKKYEKTHQTYQTLNAIAGSEHRALYSNRCPAFLLYASCITYALVYFSVISDRYIERSGVNFVRKVEVKIEQNYSWFWSQKCQVNCVWKIYKSDMLTLSPKRILNPIRNTGISLCMDEATHREIFSKLY